MALRTLRLQLRFLLPLVLTMVAAAYLALPWIDQVTLRWFSRDLSSRGQLVAGALSDSVVAALRGNRLDRLLPLLERTTRDERLFAVGLCSPEGRLLQHTGRFPADLACTRAQQLAEQAEPLWPMAGGAVHVGVYHVMGPPTLPETPATSASEAMAAAYAGSVGGPTAEGAAAPVAAAPALPLPEVRLAELVMLHDLSFIERRTQDSRRFMVWFMAGLGLVIALITVVVAQLSWRGWVNGARALMRGEGLLKPLLPAPELAPLAQELRTRLRDLEDEYRRAQEVDASWTADRLRSLLRTQLSGDQIIVVSNREPYMHERGAAGIEVRRPASGLVTAVEPVMRACSGTWIAHGSGSADREVVDGDDRVSVPPGHADYWLRRIWLTEQEEQGYYYGFANEGLWPLCHVAHVRPVFRESDWEAYKAVNQRFADAVVAEARREDPVVLVQDYHFALLPAMVRDKLPQATILTFWHIPWPNPESFGICPWRREILQGMLGSSILGFHTRYHCKNFIETVDRYLEARIEHEHSIIAFNGRESLIESYPISIDWPADPPADRPSTSEVRERVLNGLGLVDPVCLVIGVDRFDYTKGIIERLHAVEHLLEQNPEWIGRFVFVQVAAPTRSALEEYRSFQERVERLAARINQRFGRAGYTPVVLLARHHEPEEVQALMRAADICVVTSLHDGMNLVSKEFVAVRDDLRGVLVLSRFAGAARELREALIVNPYHVEETAQALLRAATMPEPEQRERMASLRSTVREFNVFRWAGRMLSDAGRSRMRARIEDRVRRFGPD